VPTDVLQTPQELKAQLAEQLDFLTTSADRFDRGATAEAKRLALAIRILVHDYRQSRSVLGQLGRKGVKFFDSAGEYDSENIADHWGLVLMAVGGGLPSYVAPLDDLPTGQGVWTDFDSWWGKVVFRDSQKREITRGELVLAVANQDGGAHVDPSLREVYAALSRQNSLGWTMVMGAEKRPADPPSPCGCAASRPRDPEIARPELRQKAGPPAWHRGVCRAPDRGGEQGGEAGGSTWPQRPMPLWEQAEVQEVSRKVGSGGYAHWLGWTLSSHRRVPEGRAWLGLGKLGSKCPATW
jgi:hypothetical protein